MKINDMCGEKNTGKKSDLIIIKNFYRLYKNKVKETVAWNDEVLRWCLNAAKDSGMKFYDLSDVTDYKILQGMSGIMISGILPTIYFPAMDTTNVLEGGLRLHDTKFSLELFSKRSFTLYVVMQLWLNRSLSIKRL